nr:PREDICTED: rho GTPase-activating protein SYDE1 [Equus przewalskii]
MRAKRGREEGLRAGEATGEPELPSGVRAALRAPSPCPCWGRALAGAAPGGSQRVGSGSHYLCALPGRPAQHPEPSPPESEPQAAEGPQAGAEGPPSPEAPRSPARGAYLQSLEPSSRRWVLGGAKPPEDAALGPGAPGSGEPAGEIWYNPIPEEDPRAPAPEPLGPQPGSAEPEGLASQGAAPASPPTKASRTKSPGPARRLSMKMKKLPELRRRLSLRGSRAGRERERAAPAGSVISRYHLDSSVGTPGRAAVAGGLRGPRAGYLSDGDSPERPVGPPSPTAFRPYEVGPLARGPPAALWGRLSLHLYGLGGLRPAPGATPRDLCCLLQVDGVARARTGPLRAGPDFLRLDHTFHLELEAARLLRALVLAWDPGVRRHRPCAQGTVLLPTVFRGCQAQQLAVRLEPQGLLYAKLTLSEQQEAPGTAEPRVFGLPLPLLVEREQPPGQVPLIIQKCVGQIERRGLRPPATLVCGSAAMKKELRDAFERDSAAVCLSEDLYPDINVITGILKDYLRELPTPLITQPLYQVVLEAMAQGPPSRTPPSTEGTRGLLSCLPDVERATLTLLLDHLRLVSSFHAHNRMTPQNLAVCFGPVLLPEEDEEAGERAGPADFEDDFEAPFNAHLNLKDFDALILDLERELSKQINVCL